MSTNTSDQNFTGGKNGAKVKRSDEEGEAISVVVRWILRDELKRRGYLKIHKSIQSRKNGG